jgi:hypothetical protein
VVAGGVCAASRTPATVVEARPSTETAVSRKRTDRTSRTSQYNGPLSRSRAPIDPKGDGILRRKSTILNQLATSSSLPGLAERSTILFETGRVENGLCFEKCNLRV